MKSGMVVFVLSVCMFITGACGMVNEYLLGTLGSNLMGSTHEQIYVIIGIMMAAMGLGSWLSTKVEKNLMFWFIMTEVALGIIGGLSVLAVYAAYSYMAGYSVILYTIGVVIGALVGMEIPLVIRIVNQYKDVKNSLGYVLTMDYVGSLVGALVFAFFLITLLPLYKSSILVGMLNILVAGAALMWLLKHSKNVKDEEKDRITEKQRPVLIGSVVFSIFLLIGVYNTSDGYMNSMEQMSYRDPIVHSETSPYQHIVITKRQERVNLYINGHLQLSSTDEHIYHEMLVHPTMSLSNARKVLVLGGGDGMAMREILKYDTVEQVTLVDLDPAIVKLASSNEYMIAMNHAAFFDARIHVQNAQGITETEESAPVMTRTILSDRYIDNTEYQNASVRVINMDAALFLKGITERYDAVVIDFPDPNCVELAKLYSVTFYRDLQRVLNPGGFVVVQSTSPYHAKRVFLCIGETMKAAGWNVMPYHQNVPSFGHWGWNMAWLHNESADDVASRLEIDVPTRYITNELARSATIFPGEWLNYDLVEPSTQMTPRIIDYHRQSWRN